MNILLTGGAGYIGSHVLLNLVDNGHNIHVIDNLATGTENLIPSSVPRTICSISDDKKISEILTIKKFDLIMHFAAFIKVNESVNFPEKYFKNNTEDSIKFFELCYKFNLKNVVFSSTASVYGDVKTNKLIDENNDLSPKNPYAMSKLKVEKYLQANNDKYNYIILRYFNVAGSDPLLRTGQVSKEATHLIKVLSEIVVGKRNKFEIYGNDYDTKDGTAIRDYIHVSDLADIHVQVAKLLLNTKKSNVFNCGYGKGFSVLEVLNKFKEVTKKQIDFEFKNRREGDVEKLISNTKKIHDYINWQPKHNNLEEIIKSSIQWEEKIYEKSF